MTLMTPSPRARSRKRVDSLPLNVHFPLPNVWIWLILRQTRANRSPTRSQRKEDRLPKRHYNIFDQTLLPEEDFSGGKLLRKRKTSGGSDPPPNRKRKSSSPEPSTTNNFDQIEVSSRPRIPPRPVSQPVTALQRITTPPPKPASSYIATTGGVTAAREFRVRDKSINYTIPSLKSLLPTPPHRRRSSAPSQIQVPKVRAQSQIPISSSKSPVSRPKIRTIIQRNGQKSLLIKLRIASNKLAPLLHKPRIRIVESTDGRKRRIREIEEQEVIELKREPEKPFGGILTKEDADTSKTTPSEIDRARFDRARESATALPPKIIMLTVDSSTEQYYSCEIGVGSPIKCRWSSHH